MAVSEMSSMSKSKSHDARARLQETCVHSKVCWTTREGLHIDSPLFAIQSESFKGALLAQNLNLIDVLSATVVASSWVTLRVLVREAGT